MVSQANSSRPQFAEGQVDVLGDGVRYIPSQIRASAHDDQAHPITPHLRANTGQVVKVNDSPLTVYSSLNTHNTIEVLNVYDEIRKPVAWDATSKTIKTDGLMEFPQTSPHISDIEKVHAGGKDQIDKVAWEIQDAWSFRYRQMLDEAWDAARVLLRSHRS
ncbi:hypothetical protein QCA50_013807 [Cerrena zonata]|uniref:Uncharacterized protein n=1 Tax=Cerrena zonata TaxID=2478898 RepID=A0AAW0FVM4_9APHY